MSCKNHEANLSALLDGELSALDERRLRQHVAVCAECRAAYRQLESVSRSLRAWDAPHQAAPSASFARQVVELATDRRKAKRPPRHRPAGRVRPLIPLLAVAASLMLLLGGSTAYLLSVGGPEEALPPAGAAPDDAVAAYRARASKIEEGDAAAHLALARWCRERGLDELAAREYLSALGADPALKEPRDALADLAPGWPELPDLPLAEVPEVPDFGPALPPRPAPPIATELRGKALYESLGLADAGDRWLSEEARARVRDHREQEELLARDIERKKKLLAQAPETSGDPGRPPHAVAAWVAKLDEGREAEHEDIVLVPLTDGDGDPGISAVGLDEALRDGILKVREAGSRVMAVNRDPERHVFLAAGDILVGGNQDRVLTRSALIPPKTTTQLPVLCCEHGRSVGPSPFFRQSPGLATPSIRQLLLGARAQGAVWGRIDEHLERLQAENSTQALREVYDRGRGKPRIQHYLKALLPALESDSVVGFAVFSHGRFLGAEVFANHSLLFRFGPRFLHSYVLEALTQEPGRTADRMAVAQVLDAVKGASFIQFQGQETEFVNRGRRVCGAALIPVAGSLPLHVSIFLGSLEDPPRPPGPGESPPTGTDPDGPDDRDEPPDEGEGRRRGGRNGRSGDDPGVGPNLPERPKLPPKSGNPPDDGDDTPPPRRRQPTDPPRLDPRDRNPRR